MPIQKRHFIILLKAVLDVAIIVIGFQAAYLLQVFAGMYDFQWGSGLFRFQISLAYACMFVITAQRMELYKSKASLFNFLEKTDLLRVVFITAILFLAFNSVFQFIYDNRDLFFTSLVLLILLGIHRHFLFQYHHKKYLEGKHERKILIYGAGDAGKLLFKKMYFMEGGDYSLVGFLDDNIAPGSELTLQRSRSKASLFTAKVLGGLSDLGKLVLKHNIYQVILAMPSVTMERTLTILEECKRHRIHYAFVPHLYELRLEQVDTKNIGDIPLLIPKEFHQNVLYLFEKRFFDFCFSATILLLLLPLFPILALLVKCSSPGPIFFKQERSGKNGNLFTMYKFRTMSVDTPVYMPSPASNKPSQYVSKIGSFLRDTNLDEVPQLWNVLLGEMSIVGPRPEMPFHVEKYDSVQMDRLKVKPGLTGLWQISPDRDKEIHDNIDYDLYYINHQSFFGDLVLVIETFLLTIAAIGHKIERIFFKKVSTLSQNKESSSLTPSEDRLPASTREGLRPS